MPQPIDVLYLAPHLDDAPLSCGGAIHRHAAAGRRVAVVTVCAGNPPPGSLSPFALALHVRWGGQARPAQAAATLVAQRRAEDAAALQRLGAAGLYLDVPDCIYRRDAATGAWLYASEAALFSDLHPTDERLAAQVAEQLAALADVRPQTPIYAPLTVGNHVDHQLVRRAAERWRRDQPPALIYYEDYPYAEHADQLQRALQPPHAWRPALIPLVPDDLQAKLDAITRYRSQISTFWEDELAMAQAVRAFAHRRGGESGPAEQVWQRDRTDVP